MYVCTSVDRLVGLPAPSDGDDGPTIGDHQPPRAFLRLRQEMPTPDIIHGRVDVLPVKIK
jgi:hypothetical protein